MSTSKLSQIKVLINLARIDGGVAEKERTYIYTIGKANGISESALTPLFDQDHEIIVPANLTNEEKFQYIFSLVQLMKIDERLYKSEIQYCAKITSKLGYSQDALFDLMLHVNATTPASNDAEVLEKLITKHLITRLQQ